MIGGPPCQDFSSAGKRQSEGKRADLTLVFSNLVCKISPEWFVMENVPQVQKSKVFLDSESFFRKAGYGISKAKLDSSYYGVPQKRERVFVVGKNTQKMDF